MCTNFNNYLNTFRIKQTVSVFWENAFIIVFPNYNASLTIVLTINNIFDFELVLLHVNDKKKTILEINLQLIDYSYNNNLTKNLWFYLPNVLQVIDTHDTCTACSN